MRRCTHVMAVLGVLAATAGLVHASATPAQKCAVAKSKAAVKKIGADAKCWQTAILRGATFPDLPCLTAAATKFDVAITKADAMGGCLATDDKNAIEDACVTCVDNIVALTPATTTTTTTTVCSADGDFCNGNLDCCSGFCTASQCTATPCVPNGDPCGGNGDCCSGFCGAVSLCE